MTLSDSIYIPPIPVTYIYRINKYYLNTFIIYNPQLPAYLRRLIREFGLNAITLMPTESVKAPPKPCTVWYVVVVSTSISSPDHCESSDGTKDPSLLRIRNPVFEDVYIVYLPTDNISGSGIWSQYVELHMHTVPYANFLGQQSFAAIKTY